MEQSKNISWIFFIDFFALLLSLFPTDFKVYYPKLFFTCFIF